MSTFRCHRVAKQATAGIALGLSLPLLKKNCRLLAMTVMESIISELVRPTAVSSTKDPCDQIGESDMLIEGRGDVEAWGGQPGLDIVGVDVRRAPDGAVDLPSAVIISGRRMCLLHGCPSNFCWTDGTMRDEVTVPGIGLSGGDR